MVIGRLRRRKQPERPGRQGPLPPILPIFDVAIAPVSVEHAFAAFAAGGARWVQYRDKAADDETFARRARRAHEIASDLGLYLMLNDRVEIAAAIGGTGVHLGQQDLPVAEARRRLGPEEVIGLSTGPVEEAVAAAGGAADYIAVGPIFGTATKADAGAPVGLDHVRRARRQVGQPLVAIGGITPGNAAQVTAAGADCVAAIASLLSAPDMAAATDVLRRAAEHGRAQRI